MNKQIKGKSRLTILLSLLIILMLVLTGCGRSSYTSSEMQASDTSSAPSDFGPSNGFISSEEDWAGSSEIDYDDSYDVETGEAVDSKEDSTDLDVNSDVTSITSLSESLKDKKLKLVYTADMYIQSVDFDETQNSIIELVNQFDGYIETTNIDNGGYYSNGNYKSGYFTVRIPTKNYDAFINSIGENCHIESISQNVENISEAYYETSGRLETAKIKQERLQELLKKATNMADIIEIESALSEVEYMIEQYTSTIRHFDSLVDYSTVNISLDKVSQVGAGVDANLTFGEKLGNSLKNGLLNFSEGFGDFILLIVYNIVQIILLIVIVFLAFRLHLLTRIKSFLGINSSKAKRSKKEKRNMNTAIKTNESQNAINQDEETSINSPASLDMYNEIEKSKKD